MFKRIVDVVEILAAALAVVVVVLLFVEKAPGTKAPKTGVTLYAGANASTAAPAVDGAAVFARNCSGCHGANGAGGIGPRFAGGGAKKLVPDEKVEILVVTQGTGSMPAFGNRLSEAEIKAVVAYTRTL